jgi:hypothetical protein
MLQDQYDVGHLQTLLETGLQQNQSPPETCGVVLSTRTQAKKCGMEEHFSRSNATLLMYSQDVNHPQGHGKLILVGCAVRFGVIIPQDLVADPFFIFHSMGVHTHAPPPPTKASEAITDEIYHLIRRLNDPNLTVGRFSTPWLLNLSAH